MRALKAKSLIMVHTMEDFPKRETEITAFTVSRVIHRLMIGYMISEKVLQNRHNGVIP